MPRRAFGLMIGLFMLANPGLVGVSAGQMQGAVVLHRDECSCRVIYSGSEESVYDGPGHYVDTPSGKSEFRCNAALASGPGAPATVHALQAGCRIVINGNNANVACDAPLAIAIN